MKKLLMLLCVCNLAFAGVDIIAEDIPARTHEAMSRADSLTNIQSMISAVNKAQNVQEQIAALKNLSDFSQNPGEATGQVNSVVTNMLNDFNTKSGTSFSSLQDLITGLATSSTTTGMSLRLQQSSGIQLQNISTMLEQMEAENQAMIRYKQADIALKNKQDAAAKELRKRDIDGL